MKVLIIDDDIDFIDMITPRLNNYFSRYFHSYDIVKISKDFDSLEINNDEMCFYFIDIDLQRADNGIQLAKRIRSQHHSAVIIFMTFHDALVFDAFAVKPLHFIRKDYLDKDIEMCFMLINDYIRRDYKVVTLDFKGRKTIIPLNEIVYLESYLHDIKIHAIHDCYVYRGTFQAMMDHINSKNICRIHKSYAVNLFWVKYFDNSYIYFHDHQSLEIGKKYRDHLKVMFREYGIR